MKSLAGTTHALIREICLSVPVSKHLRLKGGTTEATRLVLTEVSRGRSTALPIPMETGRTERFTVKEEPSMTPRRRKTQALLSTSAMNR